MRLIDADEFLEKMKETNRYFDVKFDIEEAPTVDAVPVVRCKDCNQYEPTHGVCKLTSNESIKNFVQENDFCSYGKPKDGEVNDQTI